MSARDNVIEVTLQTINQAGDFIHDNGVFLDPGSTLHIYVGNQWVAIVDGSSGQVTHVESTE